MKKRERPSLERGLKERGDKKWCVGIRNRVGTNFSAYCIVRKKWNSAGARNKNFKNGAGEGQEKNILVGEL